MDTSETLADAARSSFPPEFCRIVAMREHGDAGYVLFDTAPETHYLYGVNYERVHGRWVEGTSKNGPGWSQAGPDPEFGTAVQWVIAPAGADRVRIESDGEVREEPVENGVCLIVRWGVSADADLPQTWRFRIHGRWE